MSYDFVFTYFKKKNNPIIIKRKAVLSRYNTAAATLYWDTLLND